MREIKFRAWDGKDMVYRDLFDRNWYNANDKQVGVAVPADRHHLVTMQFTGLKDKNGTEIYEGDIVQFKSSGKWISHPVSWHSKSAKFFLPLDNPKCLEVIGNIYENKDLPK